MSKVYPVIVIIAGVVGFAGLVLAVLCRAGLARRTTRRCTRGYTRPRRRLSWWRDVGRMAAILAIAVVLIVLAAIWCDL